MDDVIAVLRALRRLDVDALARLAMARAVPARASMGVVDAAEWLVEPEHVREALERLGWRAMHRLQRGDPEQLRHAELLLLAAPADGGDSGEVPRLLDVTRAELEHALRGSTAIEALLGTGAVPDADAAARDTRGAARAASLSALAADVLASLDIASRAAREGRGGPRLAGVEVRRIAAELEVEPELVERVSAALFRGGFAGADAEVWAPTASGRALERAPRIERWLAMAQPWLDSIGVADREAVLASDANGTDSAKDQSDASVVSNPGDTGNTVGPNDAVEAATQLGLLVDGTLTAAGRLAMADDLAGAADAIATGFADEIEGVYVQPDLSIVAPGPLTPDAECRLRALADLERRGAASTYRLSGASITRALAAGADEASILAELGELSLVPLPQPVTYLVAETAARHGLVRVRPSAAGAGTGSVVSSVEPELLDRIAVDQSLAALRLRRRPDGELDSLLHPTHVAAALADARYPATLDDADGNPAPHLGPRTAVASPPAPSPATQRLAAALRDDADRHGDGDDASAWLQQRLERARRAKQAIRIRIEVEGAEPAELSVVPVSLSPKWLRVIDPDADVERTFPLAAVTLPDEDAG